MITFPRLAALAWMAAAGLSLVVDAQKLETWPSLCLFKSWWGFSCPGCGMGRAVLSAFQGEWHQSFLYHKIGLPFLAIWTGWLVRLAAVRVRGKLFSGEAVALEEASNGGNENGQTIWKKSAEEREEHHARIQARRPSHRKVG